MVGAKTAPRPFSSGSSSRREAGLDEGTVERGEAPFANPDWGVGEARAAKNCCDMSEINNEARFCDFVNLL